MLSHAKWALTDNQYTNKQRKIHTNIFLIIEDPGLGLIWILYISELLKQLFYITHSIWTILLIFCKNKYIVSIFFLSENIQVTKYGKIL